MIISANGRSGIWIPASPISCKSHLLYMGDHWTLKWRNKGSFYTDAGGACTETQGGVDLYCMPNTISGNWLAIEFPACLFSEFVQGWGLGHWPIKQTSLLTNLKVAKTEHGVSRKPTHRSQHPQRDQQDFQQSTEPCRVRGLSGFSLCWGQKRAQVSREGPPGMKNKARDLRCFRGAGDIGFAKNFYFSFLLNLPRPEGAIVIADNTVV